MYADRPFCLISIDGVIDILLTYFSLSPSLFGAIFHNHWPHTVDRGRAKRNEKRVKIEFLMEFNYAIVSSVGF